MSWQLGTEVIYLLAGFVGFIPLFTLIYNGRVEQS